MIASALTKTNAWLGGFWHLNEGIIEIPHPDIWGYPLVI
jgi:hypothetical protein